MEARLHAESSMDMYSEHGFDALMREVFGRVCQALMVVSYWTPGSAHCQAESAESRDMSYPACSRTRALRSSLALHQMNSSTSGWSTSSTTIFAARRVLPPDLIVPADASAPRMKETGPEA